jgi:hypothetical protein
VPVPRSRPQFTLIDFTICVALREQSNLQLLKLPKAKEERENIRAAWVKIVNDHIKDGSSYPISMDEGCVITRSSCGIHLLLVYLRDHDYGGLYHVTILSRFASVAPHILDACA